MPYRLVRLGQPTFVAHRVNQPGPVASEAIPEPGARPEARAPGGNRRGARQSGELSGEDIALMEEIGRQGREREDVETTGSNQQNRPGAIAENTEGLDALAPLEAPTPNASLDRVVYTVSWVMIFEPVPPGDAGQGAGEGGQGEGGGR
jgi:hypothetical protein